MHEVCRCVDTTRNRRTEYKSVQLLQKMSKNLVAIRAPIYAGRQRYFVFLLIAFIAQDDNLVFKLIEESISPFQQILVCKSFRGFVNIGLKDFINIVEEITRLLFYQNKHLNMYR